MNLTMDAQLAWFAGVMEAEGSISAQVYTLPSGRVRITPYVCMVNSDEGILRECFAIMADLSGPDMGKPRWCGHTGTNKPCHTIRLDGPPVKRVLEAMLPHMRSDKRRNAEVILRFIESRSSRLIIRDKLGRITRAGYTKHEVEQVCSIRSHKLAKPLEAILAAPNVN